MSQATNIGWSWVNSGSSFASIAGILAAFTISALVFLLSRPPDPKDSAKEATKHLFYAYLVAFYSFVLAALIFANAAGITKIESAASYFIGMYGGTIMAIAALQLLLAIIWTAAVYVPEMSLLSAKVGFIIVAGLAASMVTIDHGDYFWATSTTGTYWLKADPGLAVAGALFLFCLPATLGAFWRRRTWKSVANYSDVKARQDELDAKAYRYHDASLWVSGIVATLLMFIDNTAGDIFTSVSGSVYQLWMSYLVMALVGTCVFCFILSLPFRDPLTEWMHNKVYQFQTKWLAPVLDSRKPDLPQPIEVESVAKSDADTVQN
jgi:hypothetical protein